MEHGIDLNSITFLTLIALACGFAMMRLRQPAIVGYILAGVVLGPSGFGMIGNSEGIHLFAEMGVLLLLFTIGMELSLKTFKQIYKVALTCAVLQSSAAMLLAYGIGSLLGWDTSRIVLIGFVLSLSSTAVGIKILEATGELRTHVGRTTIGVLIAQDLLIIPMLLVIQSMGGAAEGAPAWAIILKIVVGIAIMAGIAVLLSRRERITFPWSAYLQKHADVAPLAAIAFCFVFASGAALLGLSASYGAFLAGLIMGASADRSEAIHYTHPIQAILLMIFFLSIGLLIDLSFFMDNLGTVLVLVLFILTFKTAANVAFLYLLGEPWRQAFVAGVVMAQIGEFSFVLAAAGLSAGAIDLGSYQLALSVIALSLILSPIWLTTVRRFHDLGQQQFEGFAATLESLYPGTYARLRAGADQVNRRLRRSEQEVEEGSEPEAPREAGEDRKDP